jgi:hypothetical protein
MYIFSRTNLSQILCEITMITFSFSLQLYFGIIFIIVIFMAFYIVLLIIKFIKINKLKVIREFEYNHKSKW